MSYSGLRRLDIFCPVAIWEQFYCKNANPKLLEDGEDINGCMTKGIVAHQTPACGSQLHAGVVALTKNKRDGGKRVDELGTSTNHVHASQGTDAWESVRKATMVETAEINK